MLQVFSTLSLNLRVFLWMLRGTFVGKTSCSYPHPLYLAARQENGFLLVMPAIQWKPAASFLRFACRKRIDIRGCCGATVAFSHSWWELWHCFQKGTFVRVSPRHPTMAWPYLPCPLQSLAWECSLPADTFLKQEGMGEKKDVSRLWFALMWLL